MDRRALLRNLTGLGSALACVGALLMGGMDEVHAAAPSRIVSLNLCADQILLDLVPRNRIAALSHLAADPSVSAAAEDARGLPSTHGDAESVLALDPDLVIAGALSTSATVALLRRLGRTILTIELASNLEGVRTSVRQIAAAVDSRDRGETLIANFDAALVSASEAVPEPRPNALVYQVNGLVSSSSSLVDSLMKAAGFRNHASSLKLGRAGAVDIETLVGQPPDLLVLPGPVAEHRTVVADNLRHPALMASRRQQASVIVPWREWLCGTPRSLAAIKRLAEARRQIAAGRSP